MTMVLSKVIYELTFLALLFFWLVMTVFFSIMLKTMYLFWDLHVNDTCNVGHIISFPSASDPVVFVSAMFKSLSFF